MIRVRTAALSLAVVTASGIASHAEGPPQRIVSTAPSLTETIFALGAGDRVVGVTTWCLHPDAARAKPKIGGYSNPSLEAIIALRPDLVVVDGGRNDLAPRLAEMGVPVLDVRLDSLGSIEDAIRAIAARLDESGQGKALTARIAAQRAAVVRAVAGRPRPRTLLLIGHSPDALTSIYAVGPKSFLGEMLEAAGGENVLGDVRLPFPRISVEEVIGRDPDVILTILSPPAELTDAAARARRLWSAYPSLRAVRTGAIRVIVDETMVQPGPRIGEKLAILAEALHGVRP
jgi:iron complex transport system substrate-binding protein